MLCKVIVKKDRLRINACIFFSQVNVQKMSCLHLIKSFQARREKREEADQFKFLYALGLLLYILHTGFEM